MSVRFDSQECEASTSGQAEQRRKTEAIWGGMLKTEAAVPGMEHESLEHYAGIVSVIPPPSSSHGAQNG
jgi:hypothetical protein